MKNSLYSALYGYIAYFLVKKSFPEPLHPTTNPNPDTSKDKIDARRCDNNSRRFLLQQILKDRAKKAGIAVLCGSFLYGHGSESLIDILLNASPQLRENFKISNKAKQLGAIVLKINEQAELYTLAGSLGKSKLTPGVKLSILSIRLKKLLLGKTSFERKRLLLGFLALLCYLVKNGVISYTFLTSIISEALDEAVNEADF
jgi:hypothetical protein